MPRPLKVAIQGDRASFHEIAAMQYCNQPLQLLYCQSFADVFEKLSTGEADKALVAISNSTHGIIEEVKQLLSAHPFRIEAEYHLPIHQHLIGLAGTRFKDIRKVISHPVALSQCSKFLVGHPKIEQVVWHDTAAAVEYVKQTNDPTIVAIGSSAAAKLYDLDILATAIQDDPNNVTAFASLIKT